MRAKSKPKRELDWPSYDAVAKDLIQRDRPTLLTELTGGRAIKQTLNVEFAVVEQRRADLLFELDDDSLFLLDCQSENDDEMEYRIGIYNLIGAQKYRRKIWPTVLYMGMAPMRMKDSLDAGGTTVKYNLVDIRAIDAAALLKSGSPGGLGARHSCEGRTGAPTRDSGEGDGAGGGPAGSHAGPGVYSGGVAEGVGKGQNGGETNGRAHQYPRA